MDSQTPRQWFVDALQRELGATENDSDRMWELLSAFVQQRLKSEYPDSSYAAVVFDGADGEVIGLEMHE